MEFILKKLFASILLLSISSAFAGDMYMNCGEGTLETMDEFKSSSLLFEDRAYGTFSDGLNSYTVTYDNGLYTFLKTSTFFGGFTKVESVAKSEFQESKLVDGFSCFISD